MSVFVHVHLCLAAYNARSNSLFVQEAQRISREADYWCLHPVPGSNKGEHYLQFYEEGRRKVPWKDGLFFIIDVVGTRPPQFEFKLGSYDEAQEKGIFIIHKY